MQDNAIQLNIAICDDEPEAVRLLRDRVEAILGDRYPLRIYTACSPGELAGLTFQLALLDVQLLEATGIELARQILERNPACRILFVSGYLHAVSQVYEVPHFCFILKDQLEEHLPRFLLRAAELTALEAGQTLSVMCGKTVRAVPLQEIISLERRGHMTYLTLVGGEVLESREKLSELHSRITGADFIRCHISYIVNLAHVRQAEPHSFLMESGDYIPISRPNEKEAREAFFRHLTQ